MKEDITLIRSILHDKEKWTSRFGDILELMHSEDLRTAAKAVWAIGEIGFHCPSLITNEVFEFLLSMLHHEVPLLRERAVCALGRIGRGNGELIEPHITELLSCLNDTEGNVRMNTIWACENIGTTYPEYFSAHMGLFSLRLHDSDERTRMESPEIFRVIGKRCPGLAIPFIPLLRDISEHDSNRVVRIHALGAVNTIEKPVMPLNEARHTTKRSQTFH